MKIPRDGEDQRLCNEFKPMKLSGSSMITAGVLVCFLKVLLCASSQMGSIVECWSLRKEGLPVNNIFQHRSPVGKQEVFPVRHSSGDDFVV